MSQIPGASVTGTPAARRSGSRGTRVRAGPQGRRTQTLTVLALRSGPSSCGSVSTLSSVYSAQVRVVVRGPSAPGGMSTERPIEAGKILRCLGSGSASLPSSPSSSSPAGSSSSAVGSSTIRPASGARKPVRYQREGGSWRTSGASVGPAKGPMRSAWSAAMRWSRTASPVGGCGGCFAHGAAGAGTLPRARRCGGPRAGGRGARIRAKLGRRAAGGLLSDHDPLGGHAEAPFGEHVGFGAAWADADVGGAHPMEAVVPLAGALGGEGFERLKLRAIQLGL
jgi:hypothetical protein